MHRISTPPNGDARRNAISFSGADLLARHGTTSDDISPHASTASPRVAPGRAAVVTRARNHDIAPPPETLRRLIVRASPSERRELARGIAWLSCAQYQFPMSTCDRWFRRSSHCATMSGIASGTSPWLPPSEAALVRDLQQRFRYLASDSELAVCAREMLVWCKPLGGAPSRAAEWHWLGEGFAADIPSLDVLCDDVPLARWPAEVAAVALRLSDLSGSVLGDVSLSGQALPGLRARRVTLSAARLDGADLSGADLRDARLDQLCAARANLEGARLNDADLSRADLAHARLVDTSLHRADLSNANLQGANLAGANVVGARFLRVSLAGALMDRVVMAGVSFVSCRAVAMSLAGAAAVGTRWERCDLSRVAAQDVDLVGATFVDCTLSHANLRAAKLDGVGFEGTSLRGANLTGARLRQVRIGPDCDLGDIRCLDVRFDLDAGWLRGLSRKHVLPQVVAALDTLPVCEPNLRARVFMQVLCALADEPFCDDAIVMPAWHALPADVRESEWLCRLLTGEPALGGIGNRAEVSALRGHCLDDTVRRMGHQWLSPGAVPRVVPALVSHLFALCDETFPEGIRPNAAAYCQALYWAERGAAGVSAKDARALNVAYRRTLPAGMHEALSGDGVDAFGARQYVLTFAGGDVGIRVDAAFFDGCLARASAEAGSTAVDARANGLAPRHVDDARREAVALAPYGWAWRGVRVVRNRGGGAHAFARSAAADMVPLLSASGLLQGVMPRSQRLLAFEKVLGRWLDAPLARTCQDWLAGRVAPQDIGQTARPKACVDAEADDLAKMAWSDVLNVYTLTGRVTSGVRLSPMARRDIRQAFSEWLGTTFGGAGPRWAALHFGLSTGFAWLAAQWGRQGGDVGKVAVQGLAQAMFNEALHHASGIVPHPSACQAWGAALIDPVAAHDDLMRAIASVMVVLDGLDNASLHEAMRLTMPWFWAMDCPDLDLAAVRRRTGSQAHGIEIDAVLGD